MVPRKPPAGFSVLFSHTAIWLVQAALVGFALVLWASELAPAEAAQAVLPVHREVPAFTLTDARGHTRTAADLRGDVWIADFIFTRCTDACVEMTDHMRQVKEALADEGNVRFVSISVDPTDTPETLLGYADRQDAHDARWLFLTGPSDRVLRLVNDGFKLGAVEASEEQLAQGTELYIHSQKFVLVDAQGRIRGYYSGFDPSELRRLVADARRLARGPLAS